VYNSHRWPAPRAKARQGHPSATGSVRVIPVGTTRLLAKACPPIQVSVDHVVALPVGAFIGRAPRAQSELASTTIGTGSAPAPLATPRWPSQATGSRPLTRRVAQIVAHSRGCDLQAARDVPRAHRAAQLARDIHALLACPAARGLGAVKRGLLGARRRCLRPSHAEVGIDS